MNRRHFVASLALSVGAILGGCKSNDPAPASGGDAAGTAPHQCACAPAEGGTCACADCSSGATASCTCAAPAPATGTGQ